MLRFLLGIFLVQLATVALVFLSSDLQGFAWLRLFFSIFIIDVFASFWFQSIAKHRSKDELAQLKDTFIKEKAEREDSYLAEKASLKDKYLKEKAKIQLNAERTKTRIVKQTQEQIAREAKVTHSKANFKVGAAFAAAIGAGALMLLIELFTFGLMTLTTAGGALGGYLFRAKREQKGDTLLEKEKLKLITTDKTDGLAIKMPKLLGRLLKR
jgi:cell division protein FtsI/penicillin-binding protein 2